MHLRLGDVLVRQGVITEAQRDTILGEQKRGGRPFGVLAETLFDVSPDAIEKAWASQYADLAAAVAPTQLTPEPEVLGLIDNRQAWQFRVVPLKMDGPEMVFCTCQESLPRALRFVGWRVGLPCYFVLTDPKSLGKLLETHYPLAGMRAEEIFAKLSA